MKRLALQVVAVLLVLAVAAAVLSLEARFSGFPGPIRLEIAPGTSTRELASRLGAAGVIRYRWQFLLARALRPRATLQAGEYRFEWAASTWEIFDRIARGDVVFYTMTIPEGSNLFEVASAVEATGLMSAAEFLGAARDPRPILDLAPEAPTLEGYLFPSTYHLTRHTTAEQVCRQMTGKFRQVWAELKAASTPHHTVTLASLVEKETARADERPLVASVFANRLRRQMRLQCDPSTIYAALLENRYRGAIHRSDLESTNRYNTYLYAGLPPGPIANPGLASLRAAAAPAETGFLYFVARPGASGGHQFSSTLAEHQRAVAKYRRGTRKTIQKSAARRVPAKKPAGRRR